MKSGLKIDWTDEALNALELTLNYLEINWTDRELKQFSRNLEKTLRIISNHPEGFPQSFKNEAIRRCILSKQTTIYYKVMTDKILIISLFDNRQDPQKNLY